MEFESQEIPKNAKSIEELIKPKLNVNPNEMVLDSEKTEIEINPNQMSHEETKDEFINKEKNYNKNSNENTVLSYKNIDKLFEFVNCKEELNYVLSGYFLKVFNHLIQNDSNNRVCHF